MSAQVEVQTGEVGRAVVGGRRHLSLLTDSSNKSLIEINQSHIITAEPNKPVLGPKPRLSPKPFAVDKNPAIKPILAPKPQTRPRPESTRLAGYKPELPFNPKPQLPAATVKARIASTNPNRPAPTSFKTSNKLNTGQTNKPVVQPFKPAPPFDPGDPSKPTPPVPAQRQKPGVSGLGYSKSLKKPPAAEWSGTTKNEDEKDKNTSSKGGAVITRAKSMGFLAQVGQEEEEKNKTKPGEAVPLRPKPRSLRPRPVSAIFLDSSTKAEAPVPSPRWAERRPLSADLTSKFESIGLSLHRPKANINTPEETAQPQIAEKEKTPKVPQSTTPQSADVVAVPVVSDQSSKKLEETTVKEFDENTRGVSIKSRISLPLDSSSIPGTGAAGQGSDLDSPLNPVAENKPPVGVKQLIKQLTVDTSPAPIPITKPAVKPRPLPLDLTKRFSSERSPDLGSASLSEATDHHEISRDPQRRNEEMPPRPTDRGTLMDLNFEEQLQKASTLEGPKAGLTSGATSKESSPSNEVQTVRASLFDNVVERHSVLMMDEEKSIKPKDSLRSPSFKRQNSEDEGTVVTATYKEPVSPSSPLRVIHAFDKVQAIEETRAVSENVPSAQWEDKAMTLRSRRSEGSRLVAERTGPAQSEPTLAVNPEQQQPRYLRVGALPKWSDAGMEKGILKESQREGGMAVDKDRHREAEPEEAFAAPKRLKMLQPEEQQKPRSTYFALTGQIQEQFSPVDRGANIGDMVLPFDNFSVRSALGGSQGKILSVKRNPSLDEAFAKTSQDQVEELMMRCHREIRTDNRDVQTTEEMLEFGRKKELKDETDKHKAKMKDIEREKQRQLEIEKQAHLEFARMKERERQREFERKRQKAFEKEKQEFEKKQRALEQQKQIDLEKERLQEIERQKLTELENQRLQEIERRKQIERENQRQQEIERQKQIEHEKQMLQEMERRKQIEVEKQRLQEMERRKQIEIEKQRLQEMERRKQMERENQRQQEMEKQKQIEHEKQMLQEMERRKQMEHENQRQQEMERQKQRELERERQEQLEKEKRELEREMERERLHEQERERQREQERQRQRELDKERQLLEIQKEKQKIEELERQQLLEFQKQKQKERERQQLELEKQRLKEKLEREEAEKIKQMALEQEMLRLKELEKERERQREMECQKEMEKEKQRQLERQRQLDIERQELENQRLRQRELEKERLRKEELERLMEMEKRQLQEFEKQKQAERDKQHILEFEKHRLREKMEKEEAEKMRQVAKQQEAERQRLKEKQKKEEQERARLESSLLRPQVLDLDSVLRNEPSSKATVQRSDPATRWKEPSQRVEQSYKPATFDTDTFTLQTQLSPNKDFFPVSGIQGVDTGFLAKFQPTHERDISWKVPPQSSIGFSSPVWAASPQDPWELRPVEIPVDKPVAESRKHSNIFSPEQLLLRQEERLQAPQMRWSALLDAAPTTITETKAVSSPGGVSSNTAAEQIWLPRELLPPDSRGGLGVNGRSQLNRMRSRSVSRRSAPLSSTVEGSLSRMRSRSAHRERDRNSWVQQKQSVNDEEEVNDSETPVCETDSQYGTWETGLRTDDSLTPATPSSESNLSPSPRKPTPPHTPGDRASQFETDTVDSLLSQLSSDSQTHSFPDAPINLLDTSILRSRAQLGKKRAPRTRPTRAARQTAAQAELEGGNKDWLYTDSTEAKVESKEEESDSEEQPRGANTAHTAAASQPQRVALFPGMDPSALKAQLKKRGESDSQTDGATPSPSQLSRSPKSPFLRRATRVLPPPGGKENGEEDSPQWLKELKSKKRLSQYESEN